MDEEIRRIDDKNFLWLISVYANPQGALGLELFDKNYIFDFMHLNE